MFLGVVGREAFWCNPIWGLHRKPATVLSRKENVWHLWNTVWKLCSSQPYNILEITKKWFHKTFCNLEITLRTQPIFKSIKVKINEYGTVQSQYTVTTRKFRKIELERKLGNILKLSIHFAFYLKNSVLITLQKKWINENIEVRSRIVFTLFQFHAFNFVLLFQQKKSFQP